VGAGFAKKSNLQEKWVEIAKKGKF